MENGNVIAATSGHNRQAAYGDDFINRIVCEAIHSSGVNREQIDNAVISGNTTITHLLLGIEPRYIRHELIYQQFQRFRLLRLKI